MNHADLNARAAKLAEWRQMTWPNNAAGKWILDDIAMVQAAPPDYCSSLDLIRRDLLPLASTSYQHERIVTRILRACQWPEVPLWAILSAPSPLILWAIVGTLDQTYTEGWEAICEVLEEKHESSR
jgi:mannosyltransferase OCH1-like enzyme